MTDFKNVALAEIRPDPSQPRKFFDKNSLDELTDSVKKDGVLEPIMIRPNGKGFIIVYGERRFKAATAAGLTEIPAQIRTLSPDEAFEFQITENLHRKDVHPMEEANSYERLQKKDPVKNTVKELATRFAKSEVYVTQRLSFNKLIPELQKEFYEGKFMTGHAVLFSRLLPSDQKETKKNVRDFGSVSDLSDYIERHITRDLSKAPFSKTDLTLNPAAGACTTCPKRSGCNQLLFPDIKEADRCFDISCFHKKFNVHFNKTLLEIIESKPEINILIDGYPEPSKEVMKLLKDHKISTLSSGSYSSDTWKGSSFTIKAKGFHAGGYNLGKTETIYLRGTASSKNKGGKTAEPSAKDLIAGIQTREKRAKELDDVKMWDNLKKHFSPGNNSTFFKGDLFTDIEREAIANALYNKLDFTARDDFKKTFKIKGSIIGAIPADLLQQMIRYFMLSVLPPQVIYNGLTPDAKLSIKIAEEYFPGVLKDVQDAQTAIATKRQERVKKRIADLQPKKSAKTTVNKSKKTINGNAANQ